MNSASPADSWRRSSRSVSRIFTRLLDYYVRRTKSFHCSFSSRVPWLRDWELKELSELARNSCRAVLAHAAHKQHSPPIGAPLLEHKPRPADAGGQGLDDGQIARQRAEVQEVVATDAGDGVERRVPMADLDLRLSLRG